jgi:hypothetical protein
MKVDPFKPIPVEFKRKIIKFLIDLQVSCWIDLKYGELMLLQDSRLKNRAMVMGNHEDGYYERFRTWQNETVPAPGQYEKSDMQFTRKISVYTKNQNFDPNLTNPNIDQSKTANPKYMNKIKVMAWFRSGTSLTRRPSNRLKLAPRFPTTNISPAQKPKRQSIQTSLQNFDHLPPKFTPKNPKKFTPKTAPKITPKNAQKLPKNAQNPDFSVQKIEIFCSEQKKPKILQKYVYSDSQERKTLRLEFLKSLRVEFVVGKSDLLDTEYFYNGYKILDAMARYEFFTVMSKILNRMPGNLEKLKGLENFEPPKQKILLRDRKIMKKQKTSDLKGLGPARPEGKKGKMEFGVQGGREVDGKIFLELAFACFSELNFGLGSSSPGANL